MKHYLITFLIFLLISSGSMAQEVAVEAAPEKLSNAVNTGSEETLPLLSASGDRLYFVRSFYDSNVGGRFAGQDIWYSDRYRSGRWQEAVNLSELNTDLNNAIIGTNQSENTLFLLNSYASSARKAYGIAQTHLKNGKWTVPLDFPLAMEIEGELRSFYISPQQDVVIYSTRSFNSYGKEDLYLYYRKNTAWVGPIHLDDNINSAGAEISPFLTEDRKALFFASDGRDGHGDFDIYMTERLYDASWQDWTPAINLGDTINTKGFEAYFSTYPSGESYFASDREGASLDLYRANISITYRDDQVKPVAPADSDGDGVLDKDDQCPNVIGTVANRGCPEVTEEVQKQLNDYARTILFDTGKSTIKAESFPVMVDIIQILNEYPYANFTIEGHTDNVGSDLLNQRLSDNRANAVRDFLIDNGISPNRLMAIGYGESRPIDTNYTITGRALNRRVEINLIKKN